MGRANVTRVSLVSLCKCFWEKTMFSLQLPNEYDFIQKHSKPLVILCQSQIMLLLQEQ